MFTMGNQAQVDIATVIDSMLDDPRVTAIGLHIEGITDLASLMPLHAGLYSTKYPSLPLKQGAPQRLQQ